MPIIKAKFEFGNGTPKNVAKKAAKQFLKANSNDTYFRYRDKLKDAKENRKKIPVSCISKIITFERPERGRYEVKINT